MKIKCISDTHGMASQVRIEEGIDMLIYAGDSTNYYDLYRNELEFDGFFEWISGLDIKHKVVIAGNHDAWATKAYNRDRLKDADITYLEHDYTEIEGLKIFGSPYTPSFGQWHFMKERSKLDRYWQALEDNIDLLITHGPAKGILDLSRDRDGILEYAGDSALLKHIRGVNPRFHIFGHLHNSEDNINNGTRTVSGLDTVFMNVSCVENGRFDRGIINHGQLIKL